MNKEKFLEKEVATSLFTGKTLPRTEYDPDKFVETWTESPHRLRLAFLFQPEHPKQAHHTEENMKYVNRPVRNGDEEMRIQFDLLSGRVIEIEELMAKTRLSTRKALFESALTLFEVAIRLTEEGKVLAGVDEETGNYSEIIFAPLVHVSKRATKNVYEKKKNRSSSKETKERQTRP